MTIAAIIFSIRRKRRSKQEKNENEQIFVDWDKIDEHYKEISQGGLDANSTLCLANLKDSPKSNIADSKYVTPSVEASVVRPSIQVNVVKPSINNENNNCTVIKPDVA